MLERMQLFPLNFYKKAKFNGSMGKMNYRLKIQKRFLSEVSGKDRLFMIRFRRKRSQRENSHLQKKESVRQWTGSMRKAKK